MNFKTNSGGENPYYTVPFFFYLPCCLNFLQTFNKTGSIFFSVVQMPWKRESSFLACMQQILMSTNLRRKISKTWTDKAKRIFKIIHYNFSLNFIFCK